MGPVGTSRPGDGGPGSVEPAAAEASAEEQVAAEVALVARELALDAETEARVAELTRAAFDSMTQEIHDLAERLQHEPDGDALDEVVERHEKVLHEQVLRLLDADRQARYRELVGLPAPR